MIGLITNCKPFFNDICDEIRLFYMEKKIDDVPEAGESGLFVRVDVAEDNDWRAVCEVISGGKTVYSYENSIPRKTGSALYMKKVKKRFVKNAVYALLKGYTGKKPAWGSLTGIRPTKLAREFKSAMGGGAREFFINEFDVDECKAKLAFDIAVNQGPVINAITAQDIDIYVGIPFCTSRCSYCSFVSRELKRSKGLTGKYLDALENEMRGAKELLTGRNIRCVYVGGGTPTALSPEELSRLFGAMRETFGGGIEFTVEAGRPDTIDSEKLRVIREANATRICVNAQTTNPETLKRIGRTYEPGEFDRAFRLVRECGFDNVNTDIILGLPGEKLEDVRRTLMDVCSYRPENVTVHTLAIKNAAALTLEGAAEFADAAEVYEMVEFSRRFLEDIGYIPYYLYRQKYMAGNLENVGYALPDRICEYNIDIMEELVDNLSFGAGAMSKRIFHGQNRIERSCNIRDIGMYIDKIDEMIERKRLLFFLRKEK
jgi:coproporphyrinogen dehydrogenase HemZ